MTPLLEIRDRIRRWSALFERESVQSSRQIGCTSIAFIPESQIKGQRTPNLKATLLRTEVLCEVKTINPSQIEAQRRVEGGVGTTEAEVAEGFMRKLVHDVQNAKEQMDMYSEGRFTRKIVYIIVNFDDGLHEYVDMYKNQNDAFLSTKSFSDLENHI